MKILIIDGNALLYRSYYAIRNLTSPDGIPTNAIYGFLRKMLRVLRDRKPQNLIVVFDGKGPSFRKKIFNDYKANRSPMPDDLFEQLQTLQQLLPALGVNFIVLPEVEADDVIGTIAIKASARDHDIEILSGDKDLAALVKTRSGQFGEITLLAPSRELNTEKFLDSEGVLKKFGVTPAQIPDLLSLMGDSSDNIPGVAGIGEKTAAKLINEYGSIDALLSQIEKLPAKLRSLLEKSSDTLKLSRELVALKLDLELPFSFEKTFSISLSSTGREILSELGLKSILDELGEVEPPVKIESTLSIPKTEILDTEGLKNYLEKISKKDCIAAVDTETTSLHVRDAELVGISFCADGLAPAYLPVSHLESQCDSSAIALLQSYFSDSSAKKCGHNIKYDMQVLRRAGFETKGFFFDSIVGAAVAEPGKLSYSLDSLALELFKYETIHFENLGAEIRALPVEKAAEYSGQDAFFASEFRRRYLEIINADEKLKSCYFDIEHPLIFVLADMEWTGVYLDRKILSELDYAYSIELEEITKMAWKEAGEEFNLDSPKQVSNILFDKIGLKPIRKTRTGTSTDQETLEVLSKINHLPAILLEYRELSKLLSTYIKALPGLIHSQTGRLHTSFNQVRTATGRLASSKPNLQNIPIRSSRGKEIRKAFRAPEGKLLISADYSQIEFRVLAFLSQDEILIDAFKKNEDLHSATAKRLFGDSSLNNDEARRRAKTANFAILYGKTPFGLSQMLGISRTEASNFIDSYFAAFPGIKTWMEKLKEHAKESGYVETLFGRKRYLPDLNSKSRTAREQAERIAVNTVVQGTAADIIKIAMISIYHELAIQKENAIVIQIHDEILLEIDKDAIEQIQVMVEKKMKDIPLLGEMLDLNIGSGANWLEAGH